jgi:recombination protein RecA
MTKVPSYLSKLMTSERVSIAKNMLNKSKEVLSTDSVALDWAMGGGVPVGELVLFWGPQGAGKTSQTLKLLAKSQKLHPEKYAIWIDTEYAFDPARAEYFGVDTDRLLVFQTNTFDGAIAPLAKIEAEIHEHKNICCIVMDSVKGLQGINAEAQMAAGNVASAANAFGGNAKALSQALQILLRLANECGILTLLTNHANMNLDSMTSKYTPYILSGGMALKHLCSTIVFLEKPNNAKSKLTSGVKDNFGNEIKYGSIIRCTVNKSRKAVEGRKAEFAMNLETGEVEQKEAELFRLAAGLGVISKTGVFFHYGPIERGIKARSEATFAELLEDTTLFAKVLEECGSTKIISAIAVDEEEAILAEVEE